MYHYHFLSYHVNSESVTHIRTDVRTELAIAISPRRLLAAGIIKYWCVYFPSKMLQK